MPSETQEDELGMWDCQSCGGQVFTYDENTNMCDGCGLKSTSKREAPPKTLEPLAQCCARDGLGGEGKDCCGDPGGFACDARAQQASAILIKLHDFLRNPNHPTARRALVAQLGLDPKAYPE